MTTEEGAAPGPTLPWADRDPDQPVPAWKVAGIADADDGTLRFMPAVGMLRWTALRRLGRLGRSGRSVYSVVYYDAVSDPALCVAGLPHRAPAADCSCGYWGTWTKEDAAAQYPHLLDLPETVLLSVEMHGRAQLHDYGLRAERQTVLSVLFGDRCRCGAPATVVARGPLLASSCAEHAGDETLTPADVAALLGTEVRIGPMPPVDGSRAQVPSRGRRAVGGAAAAVLLMAVTALGLQVMALVASAIASVLLGGPDGVPAAALARAVSAPDPSARASALAAAARADGGGGVWYIPGPAVPAAVWAGPSSCAVVLLRPDAAQARFAESTGQTLSARSGLPAADAPDPARLPGGVLALSRPVGVGQCRRWAAGLAADAAGTPPV